MVDVVKAYERAVDVLAGVDADALTDQELEDLLVGLHRQDQRRAACEAHLTAVYEARKAYAHDGSKSAAARLARRTGADRKTMNAQARLGRRLRSMPKVAAALAAGEITTEHAQLLGKLADHQRKPVVEQFAKDEDLLLGFARKMSYDDFEQTAKYWEQQADQDGAEEKAAKQHDSRRLHLSQTLDDKFVLDALLDPVGGTKFATCLRRIEKELFEADWAEAKETYGDETNVDHLKRTPAQRRADALVEMAERAAATAAGAQKPRPLITVHVGYETFAGRLCELSTGTVITPGQIVPLLTEAEIERAVFDGPNRIIELGQRTRFFTGGLRRCLEVLHRYCTHPGCKVPAAECDMDHVVEYEDGGLTVQENGEPRCPTHNRWKHNQKKKHRKTSGALGRANGREPPPPLPFDESLA